MFYLDEDLWTKRNNKKFNIAMFASWTSVNHILIRNYNKKSAIPFIYIEKFKWTFCIIWICVILMQCVTFNLDFYFPYIRPGQELRRIYVDFFYFLFSLISNIIWLVESILKDLKLYLSFTSCCLPVQWLTHAEEQVICNAVLNTTKLEGHSSNIINGKLIKYNK